MQVKQRLKPLTILITLALVLAFSSCQRDEVYFHYYEIKDGKWAKGNVLKFEVDEHLLEEGEVYDMYVEVVNSVSYPYRNLWLYVDNNIELETQFSRSEIEYQLVNQRGNWQGDGFGSLYSLSIPLVGKQRAGKNRSYTIYIEHGMDDEQLAGIEKIGLKVRRLEK